MRGEFQVATWEFAAGRYPHPGATLLILPLVFLGLFWSPRAIWCAFLDGRRSLSLYRSEFADDGLQLSWPGLRRSMQRHPATHGASTGDRIAFLLLVLQSAALLAAPVALIASALWLI